MLFNFNHEKKTVSNTVTLDPDNQSLPAPETLLEAVHVTAGETALVLLSDGDNSALYSANVTNTSNPHVPIPDEALEILSLNPGDTITYWMTFPDRLDDISITEGTLSFNDDEITGDTLDPTGGSWLLVYNDDLSYRESTMNVKGDITLYKSPFREHLNYDANDELTIKATHNGTEVTTTVEVYGNRKGFTIPGDIREDLAVTIDDRAVTVWVHTDSLATPPTPNEPVAHQDHTEQSNKATRTAESDGGTTPDQPTSTTPRTDTKTPDPAHNSEPPTSPTSTDQEEQATNFDPDVTPDVNPDFIPVVLLNTEERTKEDWQAHYKKPNGELLCGKEYTDCISDPEREHYTDVCLDCALRKPGAIPDADLSLLLEQQTNLSLTGELPFMIDRRDAAQLLVQLLNQA